MRNFLFLKNGAKCSQVFFNDLKYIEVAGKYVRFVTNKKTYVLLGCLNHIEKELPADQFCRVHRSYIVSFLHTTEFSRETVVVGGKEVPLGKQYKKIFFYKAKVLHPDGNNTAMLAGKEIHKLIEKFRKASMLIVLFFDEAVLSAKQIDTFIPIF